MQSLSKDDISIMSILDRFEVQKEVSYHDKLRKRKTNLVIGLILTSLIYAFFGIQHEFYPNNLVLGYGRFLLLSIMYTSSLFMSLALMGVENTISNLQNFDNLQSAIEKKECQNVISLLFSAYYPKHSLGRFAENTYLCLITIPFYFVTVFVLQDFYLFGALVWARLNMVAYQNFQNHCFDLFRVRDVEVKDDQGVVVAKLNGALICKNKVDQKGIECLKALYLNLLEVIKKMEKETDKNVLRQYAKDVTTIEFSLQKAWKFKEDARFHSFWYKLPHCTCPKMGNEDMRGSDCVIYDRGCILHGQEATEESKG